MLLSYFIQLGFGVFWGVVGVGVGFFVCGVFGFFFSLFQDKD